MPQRDIATRTLGLVLACLLVDCLAGADISLGDLPFHTEPPALDGGDGGAEETSLVDDDATGLSMDGAPEASGCSSPADRVPAALSGLLSEAIGFGARATGGLTGCVYHVTSLADAGPGTLRDGIARLEPLWIVFDVSGDIELSSNLEVQSDKTIDGRGSAVTLKVHGLSIRGPVSNVIVENLRFVGSDTDTSSNPDSSDAIHIADGARLVWIDHVSLSHYPDGLIDMTRAATDITVSWSHFFEHDLVMLIGANVDDTADVDMRVTLHHNFWDRIGNYAPRVRFGRVHLFNNLIDGWSEGAGAVTMRGELCSEANVFVADDNVHAIRITAGADDIEGRVRSTGDWLINDATIESNEADLVFRPDDSYSYSLTPATAELQSVIKANVGAR